jgi:hypothetical protein
LLVDKTTWQHFSFKQKWHKKARESVRVVKCAKTFVQTKVGQTRLLMMMMMISRTERKTILSSSHTTPNKSQMLHPKTHIKRDLTSKKSSNAAPKHPYQEASKGRRERKVIEGEPTVEKREKKKI